MSLLTVGDQFPNYKLKAVKPGSPDLVDAYDVDDYFVTLDSEQHRGNWRVIFFVPQAFSFVCPTELFAFSDSYSKFRYLNCEVVGVTTDNPLSLLAWRRFSRDLNQIRFPLASDMDRALTEAAGVMTSKGIAARGTFIVDPENVIQHVSVTAAFVGRSTAEILRQLEALQTGEMCRADWMSGDQFVEPLAQVRDS